MGRAGERRHVRDNAMNLHVAVQEKRRWDATEAVWYGLAPETDIGGRFGEFDRSAASAAVAEEDIQTASAAADHKVRVTVAVDVA